MLRVQRIPPADALITSKHVQDSIIEIN